ncbi:MAG: hypothetical protein IJS93_02710 [Clostridia bacterium]|nr:hypothetical protein [Clostridia bacterium]
METLKTLLQLTGGDPKLKKALSYLEIAESIKTKGADDKTLLNVLSQMNPKIIPLVKLLNSQEKKNEATDDFVQYNRPQ